MTVRACRIALLGLSLAACAGSDPQQAANDRPTDLRRPGSVSGVTGAATPLALCARSAGLVRALGLPPATLRLPATCAAAGWL